MKRWTKNSFFKRIKSVLSPLLLPLFHLLFFFFFFTFYSNIDVIVWQKYHLMSRLFSYTSFLTMLCKPMKFDYEHNHFHYYQRYNFHCISMKKWATYIYRSKINDFPFIRKKTKTKKLDIRIPSHFSLARTTKLYGFNTPHFY